MAYEKRTNTVAVSETELDIEHAEKEYAPRTSPRIVSTITQSTEVTEERKHSIPWLGLGALFISLLTVVASVVILNFVDERPIADLSRLRPASWLSAILSLNGICLHIALSEGFTVAWWYKSRKSDITHRDLHKVWRHGTSKVAALTAGRRFSYVALATLFVAVLPLNGFMLQNALDVQRIYTSPDLQIKMPVHTSVPIGWSGTLNQDGSIAAINPTMSTKLMYAVNGDAHGNTHVITMSPNDTGCQVNATYEAQKPNVGFHVTCTELIDVPFDLLPNTTANATLNSTIFSSQLSWNPDLPDQMKLQTITRKESAPGILGSSSPCEGNLQFKQCILQFALLNQSVTIATRPQNPAADDGPGLIYDSFLSINGEYSTDTLIQKLPVSASEIQDGNTTIGALAAALAPMFNGVINITFVDGRSAIRSEGFYSRLTGLQVFDKAMENPSNPDSPIIGMCNSTTQDGRDFSREILNSIRRLTFYVAESYNNDVAPLPDAVRFDATEYYSYDAYEVIWAFWLASMAVTLVIVVGVSPLFWGFWMLDGKVTMSPFETARVFSMPAEPMPAKS